MYIQKGYNPKYPIKLSEEDIWDGKGIPPNWMVDSCFVKLIDDDNNPILETRNIVNGGKEYVNSGRNGIVVTTSTNDDFICRGKNIFSLKREQFDLLYKKEK